MMHIVERPQGWTVVDDIGTIKMHDPVTNQPFFHPSREACLVNCHAERLYECSEGNPDGWPAGTLVELVIAI